MAEYFIRINGTGNAWPVLLGSKNNFYDDKKFHELSNASYSIFKYENKKLVWNILIDGGHGAIQNLITNENKIPDAIILTHPHLDHTYSVDWVVQSFVRQNKGKKYPIYSSRLTFEYLLKSYPHLKNFVINKELFPARKIKITEAENIEITGFPVFHGQSAYGAYMLLLNINNKKIIFTGDILCPLLREKDFNKLKNVDIVFADSNNRFPYPKSNHWSIINNNNDYIKNWIKKLTVSELLYPHFKIQQSEYFNKYFDELISTLKKDKILFSVIDFTNKINAKNIYLVHYSGIEDNNFNNSKILSKKELKDWANNNKLNKNSKFYCPVTNDKIYF